MSSRHAATKVRNPTPPRKPRNLDWETFLAAHPPRHRIAILVLVSGGTMREAGKRCGLRDSAAMNLKHRITADLKPDCCLIRDPADRDAAAKGKFGYMLDYLRRNTKLSEQDVGCHRR